MDEPIVTVVVSAREGHFLAERSLLSVLADDCVPFELIYIDNVSPPSIAARIRGLCAARGFKVLRHDEWIAPATARKAALAHVKTKYVAFVDNDVLVDRGCLQNLLACAEETGCGLVGPVYFQAGGRKEKTIHMAGGVLHWSDGPGSTIVAERHHLHGAPEAQAEGLTRRAVDFTEYHYVLGRMDLLSRPGAISDDVVLMHEHIDLALFAREKGLEVFVEPSARVTYIAFESRRLFDVEFFRRRWDVDACAQSLAAFERRWPNADRTGVTDPMRTYAHHRLQEFEVRRNGSLSTDLAEPMAREELAQTRFALREQAFDRGYTEAEVVRLERSCDFATLMFDGLYRGDGRPFLNHVIGTASALVRYELRIDVVQAGLMHAAYTHRPSWMAPEEIAESLRSFQHVEWLIRSQPPGKAALARSDIDFTLLSVDMVEVLCMLASNEVDMRLSGEYRATGRPPELTRDGLAAIAAALPYFGLEGLARTASQSADPSQPRPVMGEGVRVGSFRLDARNRRTLPI